jgi:predicted transcriptional regulator
MYADEMDALFHALSHADRRHMLDIVRNMPGCSVNDVTKYFKISRIAVLKHLQVLEKARLILSRKTGRVRSLYFNAAPIQMIYDRWTTEYSKFWASTVTDLKYVTEALQAERKPHG